MSSKYKLTYFNGRGLGEVIRLIFAQAAVDFEDIRIERDDWPERKPTTPFGKIPVLDVDGIIISESRAIARFVARRHGLCGQDDFEAAQCDMLVDALYDMFFVLRPYFYENDEEKKAQLFTEAMNGAIPTALQNFEKYLQANNNKDGYFVGKEVTWADLALAYFLGKIRELYATFMTKHKPTESNKLLDKYKLLEGLLEKIMSLPNIQAWIEKHPATEV